MVVVICNCFMSTLLQLSGGKHCKILTIDIEAVVHCEPSDSNLLSFHNVCGVSLSQTATAMVNSFIKYLNNSEYGYRWVCIYCICEGGKSCHVSCDRSSVGFKEAYITMWPWSRMVVTDLNVQCCGYILCVYECVHVYAHVGVGMGLHESQSSHISIISQSLHSLEYSSANFPWNVNILQTP